MGELLVPDDELSTDWREALSQIARRSREALLRHPWVIDGVNDSYIGPNGIRHMEQSIRAVAGIDADFATKMEIIHLIDEYVFGHALHKRAPGPADPAGQEEWRARAFAYIDEQIATGNFPYLTELVAPGGMAELWAQIEDAASDEQRFERGLRRLLDGIALEVEGPA
jgi:Tetracyclin repressor-like, C-terminal domain